MEKDPTKRLGTGEKGWEDVKAHPYFDGIDWEEAKKKNLIPPFVPKIKNELDVKYFDNDFTDIQINNDNDNIDLLYSDEEQGEDNYNGFTYVSNSVSEMKKLVSENDSEK